MNLSPDQIRFLDAADQGDVGTVRALVAAGVDVDTVDPRLLPRNRTALMLAARNGHLDVVETLIAAGARIDVKDKGMGVVLPGGNTALLLALKEKHVRVAQKLLEAGANPKVTSAGVSVFSQAASLGDAPLVRQLLKAGMNPNQAPGRRADLPLIDALFAKQTEVVRVLLSAGADPNAVTRSRMTALAIAIQAGSLHAVKLLLHHGADLNRPSANGATPLMTAAINGQKEIVKTLIDRDAAVNTRDRRGRTALDLVQERMDREVDEESRAALEQQGEDVIAYLRLLQGIFALLRRAGARNGDELPDAPRGRSASARGRSDRAGKRRIEGEAAPLGIEDFLELVNYTEPEFTVIAVKAPLARVAGAFARLRDARRIGAVPRQPPARRRGVSASLVAAVRVRQNPWTIVIRSIFQLGKEDPRLAMEDARELSARLKTTAITFVREKRAEAVGYEFFQHGQLSEQAQWIEESSFCWFKSRFRRRPKKDELGEDFINKIFRQQGIYVPACYPERRGKRAWLSVEKSSARAVEKADILVLPRVRSAAKSATDRKDAA